MTPSLISDRNVGSKLFSRQMEWARRLYRELKSGRLEEVVGWLVCQVQELGWMGNGGEMENLFLAPSCAGVHKVLVTRTLFMISSRESAEGQAESIASMERWKERNAMGIGEGSGSCKSELTET
jgi:hypothetical protein